MDLTQFDISKEIWKDVPGFEGLYQASNFGFIRSLKTGAYLHGHSDKEGYLSVTLYDKDGKKFTTRIHRIVLMTFTPIPQDLLDQGYTMETLQVNHKNEIKTDNRIENLEWCTREYNANYGTRGQRIAESQFIPISQFDQEGNWIANHRSLKDAAEAVGVHPSGITKALSGVQLTTAGYIWKETKPEYKEGYKLDSSEISVGATTAKPVTQFDFQGNIVKHYISTSQAEKETGILKSDICNCCKGRACTAGGYIWKRRKPEYVDGYKLDVSNINTTGLVLGIPVSMFDLEGNWIKNYNSVAEAAKDINLARSDSITKCCKGVPNYNKVLDYIFRFTKPEYQEGYNLYDIDMNLMYIQPVEQRDILTDASLRVFPNALLAFRCLSNVRAGINGWQNIYQCCKGLLPAAFGYKWNFVK